MTGSDSMFLHDLLLKSRKLKNKLAVFVVANVKPLGEVTDDYSSHSVITEYFSENELEEIVGAYRDSQFYTDISINEDDFIKKVQSHGLKQLEHPYKLIYNAAQRGTGPGRKSLIPAFCNMNKIPIMGSNSYVRSLCRHKYHWHTLIKNHGIQTLDAWCFDYKTGWLLSTKPPIGQKVIVKPIYESASIGVDANSVFQINEITEKSIRLISEKFDQPVIVQEFISGYEIEVPVVNVGNKIFVTGCIGISVNNLEYLGERILTYDVVYNDNYSFYDFGREDKQLTEKISRLATQCVEVLGIEGYGRVDFRITNDGRCAITDIATNPHITKHSSFAYSFTSNGFSYNDIPVGMLALAARKNNWI